MDTLWSTDVVRSTSTLYTTNVTTDLVYQTHVSYSTSTKYLTDYTLETTTATEVISTMSTSLLVLTSTDVSSVLSTKEITITQIFETSRSVPVVRTSVTTLSVSGTAVTQTIEQTQTSVEFLTSTDVSSVLTTAQFNTTQTVQTSRTVPVVQTTPTTLSLSGTVVTQTVDLTQTSLELLSPTKVSSVLTSEEFSTTQTFGTSGAIPVIQTTMTTFSLSGTAVTQTVEQTRESIEFLTSTEVMSVASTQSPNAASTSVLTTVMSSATILTTHAPTPLRQTSILTELATTTKLPSTAPTSVVTFVESSDTTLTAYASTPLPDTSTLTELATTTMPPSTASASVLTSLGSSATILTTNGPAPLPQTSILTEVATTSIFELSSLTILSTTSAVNSVSTAYLTMISEGSTLTETLETTLALSPSVSQASWELLSPLSPSPSRGDVSISVSTQVLVFEQVSTQVVTSTRGGVTFTSQNLITTTATATITAATAVTASNLVRSSVITSFSSSQQESRPGSAPSATRPQISCSDVGLYPSPGAEVCGHNDCRLDFEIGAFVHWSVYPEKPPLLTELVFVNPSARATCTTTSCSTEVFNEHYATSVVNCPLPPCPSNTIDCDCNIVVGPIGLGGGRVTSV